MLPNLNITLLWRSPTKGTVQSKGYDMKQKIFRVISAIFFVLIMGKESEGQESKSPSAKPVNIVVILDTSDRVSKEKNPDQADTDVEIAKNLVQSYYEGARRKMFSTQNRLAFVVPDQPKITPNFAGNYKEVEDLAHERRSAGWGKSVYTNESGTTCGN